MIIRPVATELFRADGQTNMTKLIVAFRYFANAPKMSVYWNTLLYFQFFCYTISNRFKLNHAGH